MDSARPVGTDGGEEVLGAIVVSHIFQFLAVACEEDGAGSRSVAYTNNIALKEWRPVWSGVKWLVESAMSRRLVGN